MHRLFRFILLTLLLTMGVAALAQDETSMSSEMEIPAIRRLEGLTMIHQDTNRCSASALTMQLSYFSEFNQTYRDIIARLNPYGGDVSVRIEEMAAVAQEYGLGAVVRRGGTIELLTRLIAAEFPVLIENVYYDGADGWQDWMSHNRVLMGYDDLQQQLYFFDPLLGNGPDGRGRSMTYAEVEQRWRPFNRDYLVIYKMEAYNLFEQLVMDINESVTAYLAKGSLFIPEGQEVQQAREVPTDLSRTRTNRSEDAARRAAESVSQRSAKPETFRRTEEKIGRNDLCPCGSGKKYKHCHGR